jgi:hypothetical protein
VKAFTLDTTLGELIQEMQESGQGLSLQEVAYSRDWKARDEVQYFSVLIGKGPEVNSLMHRLMSAVREATGAEGERIEFRIN